IVCLLHNHEATIAEATFASLIPKAPAANPYKVPLAGREDLPRDIALRLAATLSKRFQDQLIGRYKLDPAAVRTAGAHATNDAMEDLTSEGEDSDDEFADRRRDVRQMIEMLRRGEWPHFEAAMVRFTRLTPRLIHSVLREHDGRQLTVLCRACGIHKSDFASLYLLSRRATPDVEVVDANDVRDALVLFDKIAKPAAERAIRRWRALTPKRNSGLH
ncbi:MAG: DUF2336 domain-containing protein, partial [Alphaproteobacteria bacterium]